jgi:hypothetical protein
MTRSPGAQKAYPQFRPSYSHEDLVEHVLLTPAELQLVLAKNIARNENAPAIPGTTVLFLIRLIRADFFGLDPQLFI